MAESNGRQNGQMMGMAGMVEWQKEWQMAELQITITTYEKSEWQTEWQNGRKNGKMVKWQEWLPTYYLGYTPTMTLESFIV